MTSYRWRTHPRRAPAAAPTALLDWFDASHSRSTIQYRGSLRSRLAIPAAALDLLKVAAAVYCADRLTTRPGTWTRSIELNVPVREPELWGAVGDELVEAISFLSGDRWQLDARPSAEPVSKPS